MPDLPTPRDERAPMPTDAVVGALEGLPSVSVRMVCPLCTVRAGRVVEQDVQVRLDVSDLPAILRATLPHWSAEDKAVVLDALINERMAEAQRQGDKLVALVWLNALARLAPTSEETRDGT